MPAEFLERFVTARGMTSRYRVFFPNDFTRERSWPVILFLHGAGEGGTDGIAPTQVGLGRAVSLAPERFPFVIVFPQSPPRTPWFGASLDVTLAALEATIEEANGDRERLLLTGISMGGYGTWTLALREPQRFAALVPVCGGVRVDTVANAARKLAHIPQWVFHGDRDDIIPVSESREMVAALRDAGADVRYTEYAGVRHNSWDRAYADPELVPWLLAQRRGQPAEIV
ncbi:MAG TPA: alpha/beta fold hydrolase [Thermoanaerobaculia bacterium]|nr:alpha/beta fold hydrolase [Thermoanaerobaculia bacterium]